MLGSIERIVIEREARGTATARRLAAWAASHGVPLEDDEGERATRAAPDVGIDTSKQTIRVVRHSGAALKQCTGRTESLLCCNLRVVTQTVGCPLDCSYCILQTYQNRSEMVVQADPSDILDAVAEEARAFPRRLLRLCTGQVADSLALEPTVGFAEQAVRRAASLENVVLELKTKTDRVGFLLDLPHGGRTVVSWSLSPPLVADAEEHGAAPVAARLAAAARVAGAGYLVAFHLDPMLSLGGARGAEPYRHLLRQASSAVPAHRVAYLSLGSVRFPPAMRRTVLFRFPGSRATLAELLPEVDGKLRLLRPLRIALYRAVAEEARRTFPDAFVYLCMEPPAVWRHSLGGSFQTPAEVERALAESLHRRFALAPCPPRPGDYLDDEPR
jgi:spore photoproduct lyase